MADARVAAGRVADLGETRFKLTRLACMTVGQERKIRTLATKFDIMRVLSTYALCIPRPAAIVLCTSRRTINEAFPVSSDENYMQPPKSQLTCHKVAPGRTS